MNLAELPALRILEEHADALRAEALALPEALFVPMPSRERYTGARERLGVALAEIDEK